MFSVTTVKSTTSPIFRGPTPLKAKSLDEEVATDVLKNAQQTADCIIHVVDATNLHKTIGYAIEVQGLGVRTVIALNMMDEARARGLKLNLDEMSTVLGAPVVEMVAAKNEGVQELKEFVEREVSQKSSRSFREVSLKDRFNKSQEILSKSIVRPIERDIRSHKIDKVLLHPFFGVVILGAILLGMFEVVTRAQNHSWI